MYECRYSNCNKNFTKSCNRLRHEKTCKLGEFVVLEKQPIVCINSWCLKQFSKKSNLTRHLLLCKEKTAKTFLCPHVGCNASFLKPSKLKRHSSKHEKPLYICSSCAKSYVREDKYLKHIETCSSTPRERLQHDENEEFELECQEPSRDQHFYDFEYEPLPANEPIDNCVMFEGKFVGSSTSFHNHTITNEEMYEIPPVYILDEVNNTEQFNFHDVYDDNIPVYAMFQYNSDLTECTLKHLKLLKHQSKRSSVKLQEFSKLCMLLFDKKLDDLAFMGGLAVDLGFCDVQEFTNFINMNQSTLKRGRPMIGAFERQLMYTFWVENSDISNDRRNTRHVVKVKPSKLDIAVADLSDSNIEKCHTKAGIKYKAQRHIYSLTVRELYSNFLKEHRDMNSSLSLFYRCKPFYICPASDREMEGCLCAKCLNPHSLYNTLRRYIKDLPLSLSEYLTMYFECGKDRELNFHKIDCINGTCKNNCKVIDETKKDYDWEKRVSYYQFEPKLESYHNKKGEITHYKRTARKDYSNVLLKDVYNLLQLSANEYLLHRYNTIIDKVYWEKYLAEANIPVVWMDYSQNIKLTEKNQAQSAHFSGKQQTLHDSLIQYPDNSFCYVYHLSDDTNHDSIMTNQIIEGNIVNHPNIVESGKLVLRSDNCSTQYKSRFVFKALLNLAKKYNIRIDFFYGEAGHGRGLIDAMAWFGCKGPLRKSIVTADNWYDNAQEMVTFLDCHFKNDSKKNKEYHLIDEEITANLRKEGREERCILGCKASHVISLFPDGHSVEKWPTVKDFMDGVVEESSNENGDEFVRDSDLATEEPVEITWFESIEHMDMYDMIEKDSFVAIKSEPGSFEIFHLMKVEDKHIATENLKDKSEEHCILKNEPYLVGKWFSFQKETKRYAQYTEARNTVEALIHIGEVFSTNVNVNEKHQVDIVDYRMLSCGAF